MCLCLRFVCFSIFVARRRSTSCGLLSGTQLTSAHAVLCFVEYVLKAKSAWYKTQVLCTMNIAGSTEQLCPYFAMEFGPSCIVIIIVIIIPNTR